MAASLRPADDSIMTFAVASSTYDRTAVTEMDDKVMAREGVAVLAGCATSFVVELFPPGALFA